MIGLSIDPGKSTGVCHYRYDDDGFTIIERWQIPYGRLGLAAWAKRYGLTVTDGAPTFQGERLDRLVVEKFTPWSDPEEKGFALTSDAVEPLRCEGVLAALGLEQFITWRQPSQQYFVGPLQGTPKKIKRKNAKEFLKNNPDMALAIEKAVRQSTAKIADDMLGAPEPDEGQDLEG